MLTLVAGAAAATNATKPSAGACAVGTWDKAAQIKFDGTVECLQITVPDDYEAETAMTLGRFFPESAAWCFDVVPAGGAAPDPCTPSRDAFSKNFATKKGESIDAYLTTASSGAFATLTVGPPKAPTKAAPSSCPVATWDKAAQIKFDAATECVNVQVPADYSGETSMKLGRFFPESAAWCFQVVEAGAAAPGGCTPSRDAFSANFNTTAGESIDCYLTSDSSGAFATLTVGDVTGAAAASGPGLSTAAM